QTFPACNQGDPKRECGQTEKQRRLCAQSKILISLAWALFLPLPESRRPLSDEEIGRVVDRCACFREVADHFFVIEQHVAVVMADAQHGSPMKSARAWIISGAQRRAIDQ